MSQNLIKVENQHGTLVVDSRLIAQRLDIEHESFMKTIRKFQSKIEQRFGAIRFEIGLRLGGNGGGKPPVFALLTEPQATALMTFSRNTDEVVECKLDLVDAFDKAKDVLSLETVGQQLASPAELTALAIEEAELSANWLNRVLGIDETIAKQMMIDMVASQRPHLKPSLEQAKKLIAAADPLDTVGMNATQLGEHLDPIKTAKEVNELLEKMGLQYKMYRISTKSGKQKWEWQVTEEGVKYSTVHKVTNRGTGWNGGQIKWQKLVINLVREYLGN